MKIYVSTSDGKRLWIPLPYWIIKLGAGKLVEKVIRSSVPAQQRIYLDCIDFSKLKAAVDVLQEYKGLNIVDVKAKDGTVVHIRL